MIKSFWKCEQGVTAIEYGVIAAAMGVALVVVMPKIAGNITAQFTNIGSHIASGK